MNSIWNSKVRICCCKHIRGTTKNLRNQFFSHCGFHWMLSRPCHPTVSQRVSPSLIYLSFATCHLPVPSSTARNGTASITPFSFLAARRPSPPRQPSLGPSWSNYPLPPLHHLSLFPSLTVRQLPHSLHLPLTHFFATCHSPQLSRPPIALTTSSFIRASSSYIYEPSPSNIFLLLPSVITLILCP